MTKIQCQLICDLRSYNATMLKKIKLIKDVSLLILPADADDEFMTAFSKIKQDCVSQTLTLDRYAKVHTINGNCEFTDSLTAENDTSVFQICGTVILHHLSADRIVNLIVNGNILVHTPSVAGAKINIISANGSVINFNNEKWRFFANRLCLCEKDIEFFESETAIMCGNKIFLDDSVTNELLRDKKLYFVSGNKIICTENSISYIKANSIVGNKIELGHKDEN